MKVAHFCLIVMVFLLSACGPGNIVRLLPPPPLQASSLPPPTAASICVVNFKDDRLDPAAIGVRRDGSAFTTTGDVPIWVSRTLADELARKGFRVTFAMTASQAKSSNPDYLVTGTINEIWLKENSTLEMSSQMQVNCTLANRKGKLWNESCNSSQTRSSFPSGSTAENLLLDSLEDMLKPIASKIAKTVESAK